ncbi:hypothetical protein GCM10028807_34830 [Spirosoma daeguense]
MKRNHQLLSLLIIIGVAVALTTQAQPSLGPGRGPGPVAFAGIRPLQVPGMVALTTFSGTVQQFTANDESVLDGFTINTGSQTVAVRFPAHMGQAIQAATKAGSKVTVTGSSDTTPEGITVFRLASLTSGKTVLTETPPAAPATLPTPTPTSVKGKVVDYQLDRQGQVNGLRLSDQTLVRVPPHVATQLVSVAPKESTISVEGYVHPIGEGQVRLSKQTIINATQITVNGQSFLVR